MRIIAIAALLMLAGCATSRIYEKSGASHEDFAKDKYVCLQQSQQSYWNASSDQYGGFGSGGVGTNKMLVDACLEAHGWHYVKTVRKPTS